MAKRKSKRLKYWSIYVLVSFLLWVSRTLPRSWILASYGALGGLAFQLAKRSKARTIRHLTLAYGDEKSPEEILAMAKRTYQFLGKNAGDIFRLMTVSSLEDFKKVVKIEGLEYFDQAHKAGKGIIAITCHRGAFELIASFFGLLNYNPLVVGTPLRDERLNELMMRNRNSRGVVAIEKGKETFRLIKAIKKGGVVAMLIDQDTNVKSRFVDFYGRPAATPVGATVLALKTGAAVIPVSIKLGSDNFQHITVKPPVQLEETGDEEKDLVVNTQNFTTILEEFIREAPEQWVWMHERWKTKPGEEIR